MSMWGDIDEDFAPIPEKPKMMEWGAEIKVNGVKPEWLGDDEKTHVKCNSGQWCTEGLLPASERDWSDKIAIRLPSNHWAYLTDREDRRMELFQLDPTMRKFQAQVWNISDRVMDGEPVEKGHIPAWHYGIIRDWGNDIFKIRNQEISDLDYASLRSILNEAYEQAASGKGKERHANGNPWEEQPIAEIGRMVGVGFNTGQAIKKLQESTRMDPEAACRELLGAIVYAASAIMLIRESAQ